MKNNIHIFENKKNVNQSKSLTINNPQGYKCLAILSMLYLCMMLFNTILTNRYVGSEFIFVLGGTFTSPFVFLIDNIIAEIYGFKITRNIIFFALGIQTLFVVLCQLILSTSYPKHFQNNAAYELILGWSLVRIHISGCFAYLLAMLFNTKVLTQWKVLLKGRKFWLRSIASCTIAEGLYSFLAILLMEIQSIPLGNIFKVVLLSYGIKMIYNIIFIVPAQIIVNYIRKISDIDVYDFNPKFMPSNYLHLQVKK